MPSDLEKFEQMIHDLVTQAAAQLDSQDPQKPMILVGKLPFKKYGINVEQLEAHVAQNTCKCGGLMIRGVCTVCKNTGNPPDGLKDMRFLSPQTFHKRISFGSMRFFHQSIIPSHLLEMRERATLQGMTTLSTILPYTQIALTVLLVLGILLQQSSSGLGGAFGEGNNFSGFNTKRGFDKILFNGTILVGILFAISTFLALVI